MYNTTAINRNLRQTNQLFAQSGPGRLTPSQMQGVGYGAGIAGSVISGASPETNTGMQIAGGALSGAAMGSFAGPIGMGVGAVAGGLYGLYKSNTAKSAEEDQRQQEEIAKQQQAWMQKDAKPYDTEGFYQIPQMKYGGSIKMRNKMYAMGGMVKYGGGGPVVKSPALFKPTVGLSTEYFPESKKHKETFEFQPGAGELNFLKRRDALSLKIPIVSNNYGLLKGTSVNFLADIGKDTNKNSKLTYRDPGSNDPRQQEFNPVLKKDPFFSSGLQLQYESKDLRSNKFKPYVNTNASLRIDKKADGVYPRYGVNTELGAAKNNMDLYFEQDLSFSNSELSKGTYGNFGLGARYRKNGISAGLSGGYNIPGDGAYLKGTLTKDLNFRKKDIKEQFSNLKDYFTPVYETKETYRNTRYLAQGGQVEQQPIEVEGDETFVYPNGNMEDIKGPTHEEGGVQMQAKEGSRVYSNRIKARQDLIDRLKNY